MSTANSFGVVDFIVRLIFALVLVFASYNPSEYSFYSWAIDNDATPLVYKAITGIILVIGWVIYLRATINSLGVIGIALTGAFLACAVWLLIEWKLFDPNNVTVMTWVIQVVVAFMLAIGMSWSHIRKQLSGQYATDEIEG